MAVQSIRALFIETDITAGFAAHDTILYGPAAATASLYAGAAIGAVLPFARAIAKPLSRFGRMAAMALPNGLAALARLQLRSRCLVQPYAMLVRTMQLAGLSGRFQAGHLFPDALSKIPRALGLCIPMEGSTAIKYSQHWKFHRSLEVAWDATVRKLGRNPTVEEYVRNILPDALQNADIDPYTAMVLSEETEKQALHFGHDLDEVLGDITHNTTQ
jgi:hypothetical protein